MNMLQKIFANKVKAAREALGLSQYDLADKLHVRSLTVSKWERGLTWPQPEVVDTLAEISGHPAHWFFMPSDSSSLTKSRVSILTQPTDVVFLVSSEYSEF